MRNAVVVAALVAVVVLGCYCRRCQGQEAATATVVVNATEVATWKASVFNGLNRLNGDPYGSVCNILLTQALGFPSIPSGTGTVNVAASQHAKFLAIAKAINVALGVAIVQQATILEDNREAIDAAIASATDTIADTRQRAAFISKARALRKGK